MNSDEINFYYDMLKSKYEYLKKFEEITKPKFDEKYKKYNIDYNNPVYQLLHKNTKDVNSLKHESNVMYKKLSLKLHPDKCKDDLLKPKFTEFFQILQKLHYKNDNFSLSKIDLIFSDDTIDLENRIKKMDIFSEIDKLETSIEIIENTFWYIFETNPIMKNLILQYFIPSELNCNDHAVIINTNL